MRPSVLPCANGRFGAVLAHSVPACWRVGTVTRGGTCPQAIRSATVDLLVGTDPVPITIGVHRVGTYSDFKVGRAGVAGAGSKGDTAQGAAPWLGSKGSSRRQRRSVRHVRCGLVPRVGR